VLGVDACKRGWIGIVREEERTSAVFGRTIVELVAAAESASEFEVVAIDIPIGLPDAGRRQADLQARARVGPRWQSVFMTPVRPALVAESRVDADRINRELTGDGVSAQAYALRSRILEAEAWVRQRTRRTVEIHPEVSFATMAGVPLLDSKTTWAGVERRRRVVRAAGGGRRGNLPAQPTAGVQRWAAVRDLGMTGGGPGVAVDGRECRSRVAHRVWTSRGGGNHQRPIRSGAPAYDVGRAFVGDWASAHGIPERRSDVSPPVR
jgi:predicted RNase H-like nuclease